MVRVCKSLFYLSLCFLFVLPFIHAGSLGVSPSSFAFNFQPGLEEHIVLKVADSDLEQPISFYVSGDLSQYVTLSAKNFTGAGFLTVDLKLPQHIDKPGRHRIIIGSKEAINPKQAGISGVSAIQVPIDIFVPYPGQYAEAEFKIFNANENEDVPYVLSISSLGTQPINYSYHIVIFSDSSNGSIVDFGDKGRLESNEAVSISDVINKSYFHPGNYWGLVRIDYGNLIILNSSFVIGTFLMNLTDYDYEFLAGKISPFSLSLQSLWNSKIDEVHAEVSVTDAGFLKSDFKTASYPFGPLEKKKLEGYMDATNISEGRYVGNIILNYDGKMTNRLVAFYFNKPEMTQTEKLLRWSIGISIFLLILTLVLIISLFIVGRRRRKKR